MSTETKETSTELKIPARSMRDRTYSRFESEGAPEISRLAEHSIHLHCFSFSCADLNWKDVIIAFICPWNLFQVIPQSSFQVSFLSLSTLSHKPGLNHASVQNFRAPDTCSLLLLLLELNFLTSRKQRVLVRQSLGGRAGESTISKLSFKKKTFLRNGPVFSRPFA